MHLLYLFLFISKANIKQVSSFTLYSLIKKFVITD